MERGWYTFVVISLFTKHFRFTEIVSINSLIGTETKVLRAVSKISFGIC